MKKIEGYENVNEVGEFKPLPAGVYHLVIKEVIDVPEREYLDIHFDIADGEFKDYYASSKRGFGSTIKSYKDNKIEPKKSALPFFKAFITAVEKSNPGYKWDWDESRLVGKKIVGEFGEEEYLDNGQVKVSCKLCNFRSFQAEKDGLCQIPPKKCIERPVALTNTDDTVTIPLDSDLPF